MKERDRSSSPSASKTLERWLAGRVPEVPRAFLPMLLGPVLPGEEESPAVSPGTLARLSEASLRGALDHPGRDRQGAFDLLVGDAFITYACELLVREENPGEGMEELLDTLGKRFSP